MIRCPHHPNSKVIKTIHWTRHPDDFDFPSPWWVFSCQHMTPVGDNFKMRCGWRHHIAPANDPSKEASQ